MIDFLTKRLIDPREKVLVVDNKVYSKDSYIAVDTKCLGDYPPRLYYDKHGNLLAKYNQSGVYELDDIEDILLSYSDQCFSNHDLNDLREFLINKRVELFKKIENN